MVSPPSTTIVCPVMYRASSEARKAIVAAMSCGSPKYGVAHCPRNTFRISSFKLFNAAGVRISPGATALHRMFFFPVCVAMYLVRLMTPALLAP